MKYIIFVLLSLSSFASEPKYHFRDCVKVVNGFYQGCKGMVEEYNGEYYGVEVKSCKNVDFYNFFKETELASAAGCDK